jgi:hypothetical protein
VGYQITVQIDAALLEKLRQQVIADGLPDAHMLPDEQLLEALIRAELEKEPPAPDELFEEAPLGGLETDDDSVWVDAPSGLELRGEPRTGPVIRTLSDRERLVVLEQETEWLQVRTADAMTGWVPAGSVTDVDPHPPLPPKGNVRGIHGAAGMAAPPRALWDAWIGELQAMGMAWYKQLDGGDPNDIGPNSTFAWAVALKQCGIEPIIRFYQSQMFPGRLNNLVFEKMKLYAAEGIVWCEIGNEPNLDGPEWHSDHHGRVTWQNPFYPRTIVRNWMRDAERAVLAGVRPAFYALAPTDWGENRPHPQLSSVMFYQRMFEHVAADRSLLARFRRLFEPEKAWLAVHAATYQWPPDFDPFLPGAAAYDMCLRGYEIPLRFMQELLDLEKVIDMSTEGGVFGKDSTVMDGRPRLGSDLEHAQRTVEMFDWLQEASPLRAMCPWLICNVYESIGHHDPAWEADGWYAGRPPGLGPKPVVQAMKETRPAEESASVSETAGVP